VKGRGGGWECVDWMCTSVTATLQCNGHHSRVPMPRLEVQTPIRKRDRRCREGKDRRHYTRTRGQKRGGGGATWPRPPPYAPWPRPPPYAPWPRPPPYAPWPKFDPDFRSESGCWRFVGRSRRPVPLPACNFGPSGAINLSALVLGSKRNPLYSNSYRLNQ
jgi:hypothetical protein